MIGELTRERDRSLQWRLISCVLANGLKDIGHLVVSKENEGIFVKDIEEVINMIDKDKLEDLYKFFCENDQLG